MNRIRHASLIQSALGKHRDWESAPTRKPVNIVLGRARLPEKRFPTAGDLFILEILIILAILLQTTESVGKHTSLPITNVARLQTAPTGDLRKGGYCE